MIAKIVAVLASCATCLAAEGFLNLQFNSFMAVRRSGRRRQWFVWRIVPRRRCLTCTFNLLLCNLGTAQGIRVVVPPETLQARV